MDMRTVELRQRPPVSSRSLQRVVLICQDFPRSSLQAILEMMSGQQVQKQVLKDQKAGGCHGSEMFFLNFHWQHASSWH